MLIRKNADIYPMQRILPLLFFCGLTAFGFAQAEMKPASPVDSLKIRKQASDFFRWYARNWRQVESFKLYTTSTSDTGQRHRINWKTVARYEEFLRSRLPMVGEAFILAERAFFRRADSAFRAEPQEEMPFGFTYDRWVNAQEYPSYVVPFILDPNRKWEILVQDNRGVIHIYYLNPAEGRDQIRVVRERGRWKLASVIEIDETPSTYEKN